MGLRDHILQKENIIKDIVAQTGLSLLDIYRLIDIYQLFFQEEHILSVIIKHKKNAERELEREIGNIWIDPVDKRM